MADRVQQETVVYRAMLTDKKETDGLTGETDAM